MLQNLNFPGLCPGPRWGSLQRFPGPLSDGVGLAAPAKNPTTALGPSGFVSTGLRVQPITELELGNHTNDRFQM